MEMIRVRWIVLTLFLLTGGCSTLPDSVRQFLSGEGDELPAGAFRGTAAIRQQTIPLPVEIAENILAIEQDKPVSANMELPAVEAKKKSETVVVVKKEQENKKQEKKSRKIANAVEHHPFSGRRKISSFHKLKTRHNESERYKVRRGDTLMKIAYAKYGDLFRWRDIYNDNRDQLKDFNKIDIGMVLVLNGIEFLVIEKNGEPYLIRRGDTLKGISNKLYGSSEHWRSLWKNNPRLIKNPHRIYAGLTLYYRPKSELQVPVEQRRPSDTAP
jgi:nucleoid-associated protein YgaU